MSSIYQTRCTCTDYRNFTITEYAVYSSGSVRAFLQLTGLLLRSRHVFSVTEDSVDAVVMNRSHNTQSSIQHQK